MRTGHREGYVRSKPPPVSDDTCSYNPSAWQQVHVVVRPPEKWARSRGTAPAGRRRRDRRSRDGSATAARCRPNGRAPTTTVAHARSAHSTSRRAAPRQRPYALGRTAIRARCPRAPRRPRSHANWGSTTTRAHGHVTRRHGHNDEDPSWKRSVPAHWVMYADATRRRRVVRPVPGYSTDERYATRRCGLVTIFVEGVRRRR